MAGRIPQQFIDDLVSRTDIVDLIDGYVPLRKAGRDYTACCPFHDEKTPSFTVSRDKQFYHCFGCGAHGTVIGFMMEYEHLDFVDAVHDLAARAGLEIPKESRDPASSFHDLYTPLERAATFYRRQLKEHAQARRAVDYLKQRGLTGDIVGRFNVGFAPPGWDNLLQQFGSSAEARRQLLATGLIIEKENDRYYDRFRDRIMFPICDSRGRVIGFGGRVLGDETPKYLNSPETPLFHKGRELYGLYEACQAARRPERLVVVEGYMDVIALAQFGLSHAVATLGTATTSEHVERLFRKTAEVVFCFDGDRAGRDAAWRALENALPVIREGRHIRFMFLPDGEDPDTLVRKEGIEKFELRCEKSVSFSVFLFGTLCGQVDTASIDGRARLAELARPLLAKIPVGVFRHMMITRLAELTHTDAETLTRLIGEEGVGKTAPARIPASSRTAGSRPSPVRTAIASLLHRPSLALIVDRPSRFGALKIPGAELLVKMIELIQTRPHIGSGALLEHWRESDEGRNLVKLAQTAHLVPETGLEAEFLGALERLDDQLRDQRIEELTQSRRQLTAEERTELGRLTNRRTSLESP